MYVLLHVQLPYSNMLYRIILFWCLLLPFSGKAQNLQPVPQDTVPEEQRVRIDFSDSIWVYQRQQLQKLQGNVRLSQDSVEMRCDSAILFRETQVDAYGDVLIRQGDSLLIFADSLQYDGEAKFASLQGEVVLQSDSQFLYTQRLDYDLSLRLATYTTGATLISDSIQLSSVRGYYYVEEQTAFFRDSVLVIEPRFTLRADTLKFNTESRVVTFLGPTLITTDSGRIYCEAGYYDLINRKAKFARNAQYLSGDRKATADSIFFEEETGLYRLMGRALVEDSLQYARGNYLEYNQRTDSYYLEGELAEFKKDKQFVSGPSIRYNGETGAIITRGRTYFSDPPQILQADTVDFNDTKGEGLALGNVIWQDTSAQLTIQSQRADYNRNTGYIKALGGRNDRPELIAMVEGDSLFLAADTLLALPLDSLESGDEWQTALPDSLELKGDSLANTTPDSAIQDLPLDSSVVDLPEKSILEGLPLLKKELPDTVLMQEALERATAELDSLRSDTIIKTKAAEEGPSRLLLAYPDARIYKSDLQARADSMVYNTRDSVFSFFVEPVIWSDTSQFKADTIYVYLKNDQIHHIELIGNAFIITMTDSLYFHQARGRTIMAFFKEEQLHRLDISGNAESVYYVKDEEEAYIGVNRSICSNMILLFEQNEVDRIKCLKEPQSSITPMADAQRAEAFQLKGFDWITEGRPLKREDIF